MGFVKACNLDDLEEDEILLVEIEGHEKMAFYIVDGEVFATSDTCTHGEASLSEDGYIDEGVVVCSWHDGAFDIRSGEACRHPCFEPIKTYKTEIRGDEVFVEVE
ncbi:non-heme iron oxygenase ferredoxin subunit [Croceicoccus sp. YJ47]|uniref:non-heme iron oxygenase ferredoxin subunit n=1 Tax=Croceicoccus sp. YJ47 TaxID=2798724 RepID=UPI0019204899|nr:non-heme iron oxygenase ferredoxin subunit [Croceicoccus sp. YJ47]QQN75282.1 non-heme iron oxygenase ferredoxin subunit [Croceicoccus sp. YJ47]